MIFLFIKKPNMPDNDIIFTEAKLLSFLHAHCLREGIIIDILTIRYDGEITFAK